MHQWPANQRFQDRPVVRNLPTQQPVIRRYRVAVRMKFDVKAICRELSNFQFVHQTETSALGNLLIIDFGQMCNLLHDVDAT